MTLARFNEIVGGQVRHCLDTLESKGREYSLSADRLDHFKDSATEQGVSPTQALWGMASKHIASLSGMCKHGSNNMALWNEKITDAINYMLLLRALAQEEYSDEEDWG
jgi:hypothetical protein